LKKYKDHTIQEYLEILSKKTPVPGGGSAAALMAATGVALILMVANYSLGKSASQRVKKRFRDVIKRASALRKRLMMLIDHDAQAYLKVVATRKANKKVRQAALKKASDVPREVCRLCYEGIQLTPFLVEKGNKHLISDIKVAAEMLLTAFDCALINVEANS